VYQAQASFMRAGRRHQAARTFNTRKEAEAWLIAKLAEIDRADAPVSGRLTLGGWLRKWSAALDLAVELGELGPSTATWYRGAVEAHLIPGLGHLRLDQLSAVDVEAFYSDRRRRGRLDGSGGLSPVSVRHLHVTLSKALREAVRRRLITRSPLEDLTHRPANASRAGGALERVWTPEQLRRFLAIASSDRLAAAWRLGALTGMRRSELLGLPWSAVDLNAGRLAVTRTLVMVGAMPTVGRPKTDRSARTVHLDPVTVRALRQWRAAQRAERLAWGPGWQDTGFCFTREDGSPVRPDSFTDRFGRLAAKAGLPHIPLHGLRHSAATFHLQLGTPVAVVSEMLGHASTAITMDVYTAVLPRMHREAVERFAAALDGGVS
jgi:integrase